MTLYSAKEGIMKVWLLTRNHRCNPGDMTDVVVRAPNERTARALADAMAGDEGADIWTCSRAVKCEPASEGRAEVIMRGMYED